MSVWRSCGLHLLRPDDAGRLLVTDDYLRAYLLRPELRPVEESCDAERALHASLMEAPRQPVTPVMLVRLKDKDARENFQLFLGFRDHLLAHGTLEAAYLALFTGAPVRIPPLFIEQLAHVILASLLDTATDPFRLRAAECLFRSQKVTIADGRILAADEEIVEMHAKSGGLGSLGRLLVEAAAPLQQVDLDVLTEDNAAGYAARADLFDMVIDLSFAKPGLDGLCRVLEAWLRHFLGIEASIQPVQRVQDERWSWHVGLDAEASRILDALYRGEELDETRRRRLLSLFRMELKDPSLMLASVARKPIYLAMAVDGDQRLRLKPQNLLVNLPLAEAS